MEQIEGCCGHRKKSPVFSIGTPINTVLHSTSAVYAPYSRRVSVFVPNIWVIPGQCLKIYCDFILTNSVQALIHNYPYIWSL